MRIVSDYRGSTDLHVYKGKNKEPHFTIIGADIDRIDVAKVREYLYECDWTDRGSPGWVHPYVRCDEFLLS